MQLTQEVTFQRDNYYGGQSADDPAKFLEEVIDLVEGVAQTVEDGGHIITFKVEVTVEAPAGAFLPTVTVDEGHTEPGRPSEAFRCG